MLISFFTISSCSELTQSLEVFARGVGNWCNETSGNVVSKTSVLFVYTYSVLVNITLRIKREMPENLRKKLG